MMARRISMIKDITPTTPTTWTVKVSILEKTPPRKPVSSPTKYQRLILGDATGTRVQATIFGKDIQLFENNLSLHRRYYISNASVRHVEFKHRIVPHPYQWIIHNRALIVEVDDDGPEVISPHFTFIPLNKLVDYKDVSTTIDVVACALKLLPKKEQNTRNGLATIQELILVDSSLSPVVLTMWNQFVENEVTTLSEIIAQKPVVELMRVKVVSYNAISLSTRTTSSLITSPKSPDAIALQTWLNDNNDKITELLTSESFLALTNQNDRQVGDIIEISALKSLPDNTTFTLKCDLSIVDIHQSFWYMGCSICHRSTSATYMENFTCNHCKRKNVHGLPRCRITVEAVDPTGVITATIFGTDAEQLISCDAVTLMKMANAEQIGSIIRTHSDGPVTTQVRATNSEYKGELKRRFNISFMQSSDEEPKKLAPSNLEELFLKHDNDDRGKEKVMVIGYGTTNEESL